MSVKSSSSQGESTGGPVVRSGYLKKLKTSKKKYFVLRAETCESSARLEYYDSEKKFNSGQAPKRSIPLKTCFSINKRHDTKHKHVIALYTKDDCFCVVVDTEDDLDGWLKALLSQQRGERAGDGETPRPTFEHVWQVTLLSRGLGATPLISGYNRNSSDNSVYRLCLTDKTLSLIRRDCNTPQAELSLSSIRSCGNLKNFFYLETGRSSGIGAGELWMDTEDSNIAQNVHTTVYHAMTSNNSSREELGPKSRNRSSSATESSKPNSMARRQTLTGTSKPIPYQQDHTPNANETPAPCTSTTNNTTTAGNVAWPGTVNHQRTRSLPLAHPAPITTDNPIHPPRAAKRSTNQSSKCYTDCRARCDSMPSRPRTTSEGNHAIPSWDRITSYILPLRISRDSHSPPTCSPASPPSAACSTDSAGSSLSIDESEPWHEQDVHRGRFPTTLTPDIAEENCDDCTDSPCMVHLSPTPSSYVHMAPISSDDGYVDMSPRGRHNTMSPAASMSSVTSGTPSTDIRFAEYPLEKVTSYLTPSEDDETSSAERPRTYSMGSRPYKSRIEQARDRAWSVGSKSKKGYNRVLPPHGSQQHSGTKSSSAPMLSNSRLHSSHNSIGQMDDLMELDFSKKNNSGYMDMKPGRVPSGYVDMRPGHPEKPPDTSPYVDMRTGSSPAKPIYTQQGIHHLCSNSKPDYMDMDNKRNSNSQSYSGLGSSFSSVASTSPLSQCNNMDYIDMTKSHVDMYTSSPAKSTLSGLLHGSPSSIDYIDMDYSSTPTTNTSTTPVVSQQDHCGYVEMSLGKQSNAQSGDYAMMSGGSSRSSSKPKKETTRSQPIMIQNAAPASQKVSGTSPIYTLLAGRKNSTGTPPKMYLPLLNSPYSSLPRQRSRKNSSRRDSKDSSSSSINTPSSSSTIFPFSLNSPSSPIYPASKSPDTRARSGDYTMMDFEKKPQVSEYVNFSPAVRNTGDYAVMKPGLPTPETTKPSEEPARCFKPISDDSQDSAEARTRPDSAKISRPGSESSEVGSTTSTIVGSRPTSVNSEIIKNDGQLHYASLDLAQIGDEEPNKSPRPSSEPSAPVPIPTIFPYAEIDFNRSEGIKSNQLLSNAKIKH